MRLTLLGTGNSGGMPLYGCFCERCVLARNNKQYQRSPCSALLDVGKQRYLIDAGQVNLHEKYPPGTLAGIVLTHFHPDHVQGLFQLRWGTGLTIPVYCPPDPNGCADLLKHPGILQFSALAEFECFFLGDVKVTPLPLIHSKPTLGYLFEYAGQSIAYLTDTKGLPAKTIDLLHSALVDQMIIDCSYIAGSEQQGHNNLEDAIHLDQTIAPNKTILTHIGHDLDIWLKDHAHTLAKQFVVGQDGMQIVPATRRDKTEH